MSLDRFLPYPEPQAQAKPTVSDRTAKVLAHLIAQNLLPSRVIAAIPESIYDQLPK